MGRRRPPPPPTFGGTIVKINLERRFGFIEQRSGPDIFFHASALSGLEMEPAIEQLPVTFELSSDRQGRPVALNVQAAD
jgi:cold shock CspA family protein